MFQKKTSLEPEDVSVLDLFDDPSVLSTVAQPRVGSGRNQVKSGRTEALEV